MTLNPTFDYPQSQKMHSTRNVYHPHNLIIVELAAHIILWIASIYVASQALNCVSHPDPIPGACIPLNIQ